MMRFAYADPPYLGLAAKFYGHLHPDAADYDDPATHRALIERMCAEFDGWALSLHLPTLKVMIDMCPTDVRVGAWVKPFASFKKNVTRAWTWEPILLWGGRPIPITENTVRDWIEAPAIAENITLQRGFTGAKPAAVCRWIFDWLNMEPGDEFVDLFPGSGAVTEAYRDWLAGQTGACQIGLFEGDSQATRNQPEDGRNQPFPGESHPAAQAIPTRRAETACPAPFMGSAVPEGDAP